MARNSRTFSDLDLNFIARSVVIPENTGDGIPSQKVRGDIYLKYDENAIKQSVRNLIQTNHYERLFHPEIGSQVTALLFEPFSPLLQGMLERAIVNTITNFEPRVNLVSVGVTLNPDNQTVNVSITFTIINTEKPLSVDITLQRTR